LETAKKELLAAHGVIEKAAREKLDKEKDNRVMQVMLQALVAGQQSIVAGQQGIATTQGVMNETMQKTDQKVDSVLGRVEKIVTTQGKLHGRDASQPFEVVSLCFLEDLVMFLWLHSPLLASDPRLVGLGAFRVKKRLLIYVHKSSAGKLLRGQDTIAAAQQEQKEMSTCIKELCQGMGATLSASSSNQDALEAKLDAFGNKLVVGTCSLLVGSCVYPFSAEYYRHSLEEELVTRSILCCCSCDQYLASCYCSCDQYLASCLN
jgi:hypothetical protein